MFDSLLRKLFPDRDAFALMSRLLLEHGAKNWRRFALSFGFMAIAAASTGAAAYLIGNVINAAYVDKNFPAIVGLGLTLMVLFTAKGLATYGQSVVLMRIANRIIATNRKLLFDRLLNQGLGYFANRHSSEFMMVLQTGTAAAANALNIMITAIGRDLLTLISLVVVMVLQDPMMSLFVLGIAPPAILGLRKLIKRVRTVFMTEFGGGVRVAETLQEAIQGIRVVKTFTLESAMRSRFDHHVEDLERASNKLARVQNRASPLMEALGGIAVALALVYGGYRVIVTGSAPGEFVSFLTAFLLAYEPAKRLARVNLDLTGALVGTRILFQVIDAPITEPIDDGKPALVLDRGRVEFADVGFSYRPQEPVLRNVSFVAEHGEVTALVGPSGGGKSTMLGLICGLYDPEGGAILVDGQDISSVSRQSLRRSIAYVGQETFLFNGTIRDNIAVGRTGASEDEIIAAAMAAHAHDFIMKFPSRYESTVGEHGLSLSGGQRQRIAVARALLKNARIILLDEATASLDAESEHQVQMAIERLCAGRTTITVTHRLHTVVNAACIHVVEDGRIVESGRHERLVSTNGRYAALLRAQAREEGRRDRIPGEDEEPRVPDMSFS